MYLLELTYTLPEQNFSDCLANTSWAIRSTIDIMPEAAQFAVIFGGA